MIPGEEENGGELNFDFKGITITFLVAVVRKNETLFALTNLIGHSL